MLNPTEIQRLASDPGCSVYVSASAGTGKTKILCDRFLRLMLNGTPPENILCVTFTKAAAAEMEDRIRSNLKVWHLASEGDLRSMLVDLTGIDVGAEVIGKARGLYRKFLDRLSHIKIQTLHSFCTDILQCYVNASKAGGTKIIDKMRQTKYLKDAFAQAVNKPENSEHITALAQYYDFERLLNLVSQIIGRKSQVMDYLGQFDRYSELELSIYADHHADISQGDTKANALDSAFWEALPTAFKENTVLEEAITARDFKQYRSSFYTQAGEPRKKLAKLLPLDEDIIEKEVERIAKHQENLNALATAQLNYAILVIAADTLALYEANKTLTNFVDYDDLLLQTIDLLQNSEIAASVLYSLDCRIDHVLVDEAQDLSLKQWQVVNLITEEFFAGLGAREVTRTVFVVGDYKQSIYSFQGADPDIFLSMRDFYRQKAIAAALQWREVELEHSFRTTAPVLSAIDMLFPVKHIAFRSGEGHVELLKIIPKPDKNEETDNWNFPEIDTQKHDNKQILAGTIARTIAEWIKQGRELAGHKRRITASDIMILVRKRSDFTRMLAMSLAQEQIACINQDKLVLSGELIVMDLIALANFLITSADDFNLACLLKSALIGITDEELFRFAHGREGSLYTQLDELIKAKLQHYQQLALEMSVYEFFSTVLDCDGGRIKFVSRFGERANFVLDQFLEATMTFEQGYIPTFPTFVEWINNGGADETSGQFVLDNCVRIMTVHASKGLQAPIIILADAASSEQTMNDQIFWHDDKIYISILKEIDSNRIKEVKASYKEACNEESKRLLYVAMTRAEDELYLAGWENRDIKSSWYNLVATAVENYTPPASYSSAGLFEDKSPEEVPAFIREKYQLKRKASMPPIKATEKVLHKTPEIIRGEMIHDLLHKMPLVANKNSLKQMYDPDVITKVEKIIVKFPELFESNSMAEVPISGSYGESGVCVRVDRLVIDESKVKIIDFKSDRTQTWLSHYKRQLRLYEQLCRNIWPNKEIESYILWVETETLCKVNTNFN